MVYVQGDTCWLGRNKLIRSRPVHFSALILRRWRNLMAADAGIFERGCRGIVVCFPALLFYYLQDAQGRYKARQDAQTVDDSLRGRPRGVDGLATT